MKKIPFFKGKAVTLFKEKRGYKTIHWRGMYSLRQCCSEVVSIVGCCNRSLGWVRMYSHPRNWREVVFIVGFWNRSFECGTIYSIIENCGEVVVVVRFPNRSFGMGERGFPDSKLVLQSPGIQTIKFPPFRTQVPPGR